MVDDLPRLSIDNMIEIKKEIQLLDDETVSELSAKEVKDLIHLAITIILLERGSTGYTAEEVAFYTKLRFVAISKNKSSGFIQTQVKNVEKETNVVSTSIVRLFNRDQKKFVGNKSLLR